MTLTLTWAGPLTDTAGGQHPLGVRMEISLGGYWLEFRLFLQNDTPDKVAQVWYPLLGGLSGFGRGPQRDATFGMLPCGARIKRIGMPGDGGLDGHYPGDLCMSFSSVYNTKARRTMYFASHDTVARLKYYRFFEQSGPAGRELYAGIEHLPYTPPGKSFEGSPVVLRFHDGGWEEARPFYREWFKKSFGLMDPSRCWIRRQTFFQTRCSSTPRARSTTPSRTFPAWQRMPMTTA